MKGFTLRRLSKPHEKHKFSKLAASSMPQNYKTFQPVYHPNKRKEGRATKRDKIDFSNAGRNSVTTMYFKNIFCDD